MPARWTHCLSQGEGPALVLLHGVGADLTMWDPLVARLARSRRVVRYDLLGHGHSAKPPGPYGLGDFTRQLETLACDLGLARFDLVGFSMGGLVAQGYALAHPERLGRLVLLNTVFARGREERAAIAARVEEVLTGGYAASVEAAIERWFTPAFRAARPDVEAAIRRCMAANDLPAYAAAYRVFATADAELENRVQGIAAPTLVLTGSDDRRSTPAMAQALAARLPRGRCLILEGQRHMTPLEIPDRLGEVIEAFLGEASGASGHPSTGSG